MQDNMDIRVDICERDFIGDITTVRGATDFISSAHDPDSDTKYPILKPSSVDLFLLSPSRRYFLNLFTSDKFKYLVKYYENSVQIWSGYLLADLYSEPYELSNYNVNLKAIDGLGLLKNIPFLDASGNKYTGLKSDLEIINICLSKLDLGLDVYTAVDIYEINMSDGTNDDPLTQAYSPCEAFNDKDCATVLREILKPYGAQMWHQDNAWHIVRSELLNGNSYTRRRYNSSGVFQSAASYNPNKSLTDDSVSLSYRNILVMARTTMQIIPAIKKLVIKHDYGLNDALLSGGDMNPDEFSLISGKFVSNYWTRYNGDSSSAFGKLLDKDSMLLYIAGQCSDFSDNLIVDAEYLEATFSLDADTKRFIVNIEFRITAMKRNVGSITIEDIYAYWQIQQGDYFLTNFGWKHSNDLALSNRYLFAPVTTGYGWNSVTFEGEGVPGTGTIYVRILQFVSGVNYAFPIPQFTVETKKIQALLIDDSQVIDTEIELTTEISENNNFIPDEIELLVADLPDISNNKYLYRNGKFLSDGTPTKLWKVKGTSIQEPLIVALARMITNQYIRPTMMYDGVIEDANLKIGSVVSHQADALKFIVHQITSHNPASMNMQVRLIELIDSEELLTEDSEYITTEDGLNILTG
jgi:hypothetical protein